MKANNMKIVKNDCFGGFSLSMKATKRLAELEGKECYFFENDYSQGYGKNIYKEINVKEKESLMWHAFDIPNPNEVKDNNSHYIYYRDIERDSPLLLQVIEEIGEENASGSCAELKVVDIPDGTEWEIDEYDGQETIREKHRSW